MATKVTHRQEVVPLDRQNQPDQAQKSKAAKNVQAGQLGGDNLQIMRDGNPVLHSLLLTYNQMLQDLKQP